MVKLVCGCGYLGERVARHWVMAGHEVWATTRSNDRSKHLASLGIRPLIMDVTNPVQFRGLLKIDTVLFAVGFDRSTGQSISDVYVGGLRNVLQALPPSSVERFIYISSTGVYGQSRGEVIDEDSPCEPTRPGGVACLAAERALADYPLAPRRIVLRLAGIYGPQRLPNLDAVRNGMVLDALPSGYLNLIHVEDAVAAVLAAEQRAALPALYIIADGRPVLRGDFYRELASLLGAPQPRFVEPTPGSADRGASDRRMCSDRARNELGLAWKYPSYREGLASIVAELESVPPAV